MCSNYHSRTPAPAHFIGVQDGYGITPSVELFTLTAPVGEHPVKSTVSRQTLERHGYAVPSLAELEKKRAALNSTRGLWANAAGF